MLLAMNNWGKLQAEALGSHGIITLANARRLGIFPAEIYRWRKMGRLMKAGRGVYRLTAYPSQGFISDMAALIALCGDGSYLHGESVLTLYDLCPTRSYVASVAVPGRFRKTDVPDGLRIVKAPPAYKFAYHQGLPCQRPVDAIRSCIGILEKERVLQAIDEAKDKGYVLPKEADGLRREVEYGEATP